MNMIIVCLIEEAFIPKPNTFFQNQLLNCDSATRGYGFCSGKLLSSLSREQSLSLSHFAFFKLHGPAPVYFTDLVLSTPFLICLVLTY